MKIVDLLSASATDQPHQRNAAHPEEQAPGTASLLGEGRRRIQGHGLQRPNTQNETYAAVSDA